MAILITGGAFLGAILGRFFKVFVLVPASAFLILLFLIGIDFSAPPLSGSLINVALVIVSLEVGYFTGLISTDLSSVAQSLRCLWARLRQTPPTRAVHPG